MIKRAFFIIIYVIIKIGFIILIRKILIFNFFSVETKFKIIYFVVLAGIAQLVEQLICNQQVGGSNPSASSRKINPIITESGFLFLFSYIFDFSFYPILSFSLTANLLLIISGSSFPSIYTL